MKNIKIAFTIKITTLLLIMGIIVTGCSENEDTLFSSMPEQSQADVDKLYSYFMSSNCQSLAEAINLSEQLTDVVYASRSEEELLDIAATKISPEAYAVIEDYSKIIFSEDDGEQEIREKFLGVFDSHKCSLSKTDYDNLVASVDVTMMAISYYMTIVGETSTRGSVSQTIKCIAGTAGSAGLGFLAGAGVGTVTLPLIGTVSGGAFGAWSGALVGLATFC